MKAAFIEKTGPPKVIKYGNVPKPKAQGAIVLVKVKAVSVNPIDTYIRNGADYWELPKPFVIGCDLAGVVETVGPDVTRFQPGDRVWGTNQGLLGRQGTFAQFCAVDERWLYKTPDSVADETAAACALVGVTAHLGLFREAKLHEGETIFVRGGSGGVGSMVVQMAKAAGARVITTGSNSEKVARCRKLGADYAIAYKSRSVQEEVHRIAPDGVNVFWEMVREPKFDEIIECMASRGRIVLMAGRDAKPRFPIGPFYVKGCSLHGFAMFTASDKELRAAAAQINRWMAAGRIQPVIDRVMRLSEAAEAHRLQEASTLGKMGRLMGKIVLKP